MPIISQFICFIILNITLYIFTKIVSDVKNKLSLLNIGTIIIFSILQALIYFRFPGIYKSLLIAILNILFCRIIFKLSVSKSTFIIFLETILMLIPEIFELIFVTKVLGISKKYCYEFYAGSIIANLTVCVILLVVTFLLRKALRKILNAEIINNLEIVICYILTFICVLIFFFSIVRVFKFSDDIGLYVLFIIVLTIVLFSLIYQTIQNKKILKKYDKLLEFMTTYENELENQRILRHETKNEFLTIKGKIHDKLNNEEIIKYIDNILKEKIEVKQEEYAKFGYLPPNGIKGLCYLKIQEAQDRGISTDINISPRVKGSNIYDLDIKAQRNLGKILGVFLDNAIEASLTSLIKVVNIEAYLNINKECEIIISNSFDNTVPMAKLGSENFTTKGKNRGHGLLLVKHILSTTNTFEVQTIITNNIYSQRIVVKKTEKLKDKNNKKQENE